MAERTKPGTATREEFERLINMLNILPNASARLALLAAFAAQCQATEEATGRVERLEKAVKDKIAACEQFSRLAAGFAAEAVASPAHWAGADARAQAMKEAAEMFRAALGVPTSAADAP